MKRPLLYHKPRRWIRTWGLHKSSGTNTNITKAAE